MPHTHITEELWGRVLENEKVQTYRLASWAAFSGSYASNIDFDSFGKGVMAMDKEALASLFPYYNLEAEDKTLTEEDKELANAYKRWTDYLARKGKI